MSLRKKKNELRRLISAFESESIKFRDLTFSTFYIADNTPSSDRKFKSPNHAIMLWQYYGSFGVGDTTEQLAKDLDESDMQWGMRGSKITLMGVLEGDSCALFARMAKRAGAIFSPKESLIIKTRNSFDIANSNISDDSKPAVVSNGNELAIWLNYLLLYVHSKEPEIHRVGVIEPDPYSLSLMALEGLLDNPYLEDSSAVVTKLSDINFRVAISYPGEKREYVANVVNELNIVLKKDEVFYDLDYQAHLAVPNLDTVLQEIYRNNSDLVVVFLCGEYSEKEWCGIEWRAVKDIIKAKEDKVMLIRFDDAIIDGLFSTDGYIDANIFTEQEVAKFILERLALQ